MYTLRSYQQDAVNATIAHFRQHSTPAVLVLPTGAGKSLVIAELARIARGRVLVLTHVKELVEQNHAKYESYDLKAGIFSAGLGRKETQDKVVFASVQSMVNGLEQFNQQFSIAIIDECHRIPNDQDSAYHRVIKHIQTINPNIKILGLTATPYRLGKGWIYQYHARGKKGQIKNDTPCFFRDCIFELPIRHLLDEGYLTPAKMMDMALLSYDFSQLIPVASGHYKESDLNQVINDAKRVTPQIIKQVIDYAMDRKGVMIFASTVNHAKEIMSYLKHETAALVIGDTPLTERATIIEQFKAQKIKYLVNVSVLTTGFDAPHVDLIAVLRPTESVSLYQQIVGRGLRLFEGKSDCLILEYAGNHYDLNETEIGMAKPDSTSDIVTIPCPACGFLNKFWGKTDAAGFVLEHYGRQCQGYLDNEDDERQACGYRFRAKFCNECGADNDIAARQCHQCHSVMVDPDKKLREALKLKDYMVVNCSDLVLKAGKNQFNQPQLTITYITNEALKLTETWQLSTKAQKKAFLQKFINPHLIDRHRPFTATAPSKIIAEQHRLRSPQVIIARKQGYFWKIRDKLFDIN